MKNMELVLSLLVDIDRLTVRSSIRLWFKHMILAIKYNTKAHAVSDKNRSDFFGNFKTEGLEGSFGFP